MNNINVPEIEKIPLKEKPGNWKNPLECLEEL
jgi:hypothetical protein